MTVDEALEFVREHGIVLQSANGPVPSLAAAITGGPARGNWWDHPRGREIFRATRWVRGADDVLVCRLVDGKITYVHRRLWPALVRLAAELGRERLAKVVEVHTSGGRHHVAEVPFPDWVPQEARRAAESLTEADARQLLGSWAAEP